MSENHGRFIWYELLTPDVAASKRFYGEVVGWKTEDMPAAGGMSYTMLKSGADGVGGMMTIPEEAKAMGAPPSWSGYICVDDCDAAAEKVKSLGGQVIRPPADIPEIGRFAVVADPHGAYFEIMTPLPMEQARERPAQGAAGHIGWHELYAGDLEQDFDFYAQLFGWRKDHDMPMGEMGAYRIFANQDGPVGGMMKRPPQVLRTGWLFYVNIGDIDAATERVKRAGGQVMNGPMEVPGGDWIIQGADPQGAMFALVGKRA